MADQAPVVHIGENSPEEVAYKLMNMIRLLMSDRKPSDQDSILDMYAACLVATKGQRLPK